MPPGSGFKLRLHSSERGYTLLAVGTAQQIAIIQIRRCDAVDVIRPIFTVNDLAQIPDDGKRYEVLEGDLAVSPSPSWKHQRIVHYVHLWLTERENAGLGKVATAPLDVVFDDNNVTEPDVLFIRTEHLNIIKEANVQGAPDLVVEVLSSSTRERDLGVKAHLYARFGVREYWVVDPEIATLSVYHLTPEGYEVSGPFRRGETIQSCLFPGSPLVVADLFQP